MGQDQLAVRAEMVGSEALFIIIPTEHGVQWVSAEARNIGKECIGQ